MSDTPPMQPPGWYYAQGDPPGTQRYWDGTQWQGGPQPVAGPGGLPGMPTSGTQQLASAGQRIGAWLLDALVLLIPVVAVSAIFVGDGGSVERNLNSTDGSQVLSGLITTLMWFGYQVLQVSRSGQTLGRKWVGTKIQYENGQPIDQAGALKRFSLGLLNIIPFLNLIAFLIGLASVVMLFADSKRQTVWDKFAKTVTVKV